MHQENKHSIAAASTNAGYIQLVFLQYARALAAVLVIVLHVSAVEKKYTSHAFLAPYVFPSCYMIFFVVSGFVLTFVYMKSPRFHPGSFLLRRLWRVYPVYWEFCLLLLPVFLLHPELVNSSYPRPDLLLSFLMMPQGQPPLIAVGWTMVYELFFYFIFVSGVVVLRDRIPLLCLIWSLVMYVGRHSIDTGTNPWLVVLFSHLNLLFVVGMLCGWAYVKSGTTADLPYVKPLAEIGNATYSIYLSHVMIASLLGRAWATLLAHGLPADSLLLHSGFLVAVAMLCILGGWMNYRWVEKPLVGLGKKWFGG